MTSPRTLQAYACLRRLVAQEYVESGNAPDHDRTAVRSRGCGLCAAAQYHRGVLYVSTGANAALKVSWSGAYGAGFQPPRLNRDAV